MNRMIHTQSEPQTSFGGPSSQHMQQSQQAPPQHPSQQLINRLISSAYNAHDNGGFDSTILLNGGQQKFDFLPHLQNHPGSHLMQNNGLLGNNSNNSRSANGNNNGSSGSSKKKKGQGPGRRPALDANGLPKERPFVCPRVDCQKRFCRNDHLQRHMRIHTGQRLFQCRTCLRSFSRSDHLAKHERTHSADKPYSCLSCARRFHKHEEKKKHEEKCQQKAEESQSNRQLNIMGGASGHNMYQNQMILSASMQPPPPPNPNSLMMIPSTTGTFKPATSSSSGATVNPLEIRSLISSQNR